MIFVSVEQQTGLRMDTLWPVVRGGGEGGCVDPSSCSLSAATVCELFTQSSQGGTSDSRFFIENP